MSLIQPGDRALILESVDTPPLLVLGPSDVTAIEWSFKHADAVIVAAVGSITSKLTRGDSWITSSVEITVLEVIKAPTRINLRLGDALSFTQDGGQVLVGGTVVTAILPAWARPVETSKRYLMFANFSDTGRMVVGPTTMYELQDDGSLKRTTTISHGGIEGTSDDALTRLRELAFAPR